MAGAQVATAGGQAGGPAADTCHGGDAMGELHTEVPGTLQCLEGPSQAELVPQQHSSHALGSSRTSPSSGPSHSKEHAYFDPEQPEAKIQRLSDSLTTTRKKVKSLQKRVKRSFEKSKALQSLIEDL